ncbi:unnamed protein product [Prunus armeniaca]|uniref:Uncharacterized protein n=1 Tax=Prunus armeniaca TaxID=36596 RepID=A0A6J5U2Y6_PRUAR|nr:unnamed protein product [Prunus armeniaca]
MGRKSRSVTQWMMNLKRSCSWFKDRLIYQGPRDVDAPLASTNMDTFSCLQSRDLPCGGKMDFRNYQSGVEAYNPQFFNRQSRFVLSFSKIEQRRSPGGSGQAWWNNYLGRFGTIDAAYKRAFKSCPFCQNLREDGRHALLEQIATDNKLPLTISANYQKLCSSAQLTVLAKERPSSGSASSVPEIPTLVQRRQSSGRVSVPLGPMPKASNLSRLRDSQTTPFAFRYSGIKRSLLGEANPVGDTQAQPEAAQAKRVGILTPEAPELASTTPLDSNLPGPSPAPTLAVGVLFTRFCVYSYDGRAKFPTALRTINWSTSQLSLVCERATASKNF